MIVENIPGTERYAVITVNLFDGDPGRVPGTFDSDEAHTMAERINRDPNMRAIVVGLR